MPEHILERHEHCERQHCPICDGGLANCTVCHGAEAALPTECPGRPMTNDELDAVQAWTLNYINGAWTENK